MAETAQNFDAMADPGAQMDDGAIGGVDIEAPSVSPGSFGSKSAPKVSRTTLAMVGMFIAGVAIVAAMSGGTTPQQATASDEAVALQVDSFLAHNESKKNGGEGNQGTQMVAQFYHYASRRQIPVDQLNSNPFARDFGPRDASDQPPVVKVANARKRANLQREFDKLKLQGVMMTPRGGTAIINNTFAMRGHRVGAFTVTAIDADQVVLTCDQVSFSLRLER